jgi:hypothetical protein
LQTLITAIRAAAIVFGITAFATLFSKLVAATDLRSTLIMHQLSIPGALFAVQLLEHLTFAFMVFLFAYLVSHNYWRTLFPERIRWLHVLFSFLAGIGFAVLFNHPLHVFLFAVFFDKPVFQGGAVSDAIVGGVFRSLGAASSLATLPALTTMFVTPFIEELTDRGILFKEGETLQPWQIALLSLIFFCLSHYAIGGMAKVLAVAPAAALFVVVRLATGSFLYSTASHVGVNAAALMRLELF